LKCILCRSNLVQNKAKKAATFLAAEDLRVAVIKGNVAAIEKYLQDGEMKSSLSFLQRFPMI